VIFARGVTPVKFCPQKTWREGVCITDSPFFPWISLDFLGFPWISLVLLGFIWRKLRYI
jgi:hypothetical protein